MPLMPFIPALIMVLAASAASVVAAGMFRTPNAATIAAALFAITIIGIAWRINRPYWAVTAPAFSPADTMVAVRRNTLLAALGYAWGGAVLLATEALSGLDWYHYWQYGLGALLIAVGLALYAERLGRPGAPPPAIGLSGLHGAAIVVGLAYLVGAGKATHVRADWIANVVFLWGGLALIAICAISAMTQSRLVRQRR